jgi:hypothetical protein
MVQVWFQQQCSHPERGHQCQHAAKKAHAKHVNEKICAPQEVGACPYGQRDSHWHQDDQCQVDRQGLNLPDADDQQHQSGNRTGDKSQLPTKNQRDRGHSQQLKSHAAGQSRAHRPEHG